MSFFTPQIHEYILSKAPPIPQPSPSDVSDKKPANTEADVQVTSEPAELAAAGEELQNPPAGDRIVEEAVPEEVTTNANLQPEVVRVAREVPSSRAATAQVQMRAETRVPKPADDRLFTWAAVGLTLAIVVLLLKKFMKASAHGSVFMDES